MSLASELARALARSYTIRAQNRSFAVTLPPALAQPFIDRFGSEVVYEVVEAGILMKPATEVQEELPAWMAADNGTKPKTTRKR